MTQPARLLEPCWPATHRSSPRSPTDSARANRQRYQRARPHDIDIAAFPLDEAIAVGALSLAQSESASTVASTSTWTCRRCHCSPRSQRRSRRRSARQRVAGIRDQDALEVHREQAARRLQPASRATATGGGPGARTATGRASSGTTTRPANRGATSAPATLGPLAGRASRGWAGGGRRAVAPGRPVQEIARARRRDVVRRTCDCGRLVSSSDPKEPPSSIRQPNIHPDMPRDRLAPIS